MDWFRRLYAALGPRRWAGLHNAARYASMGNGHRRTQMFAEAILGQADEAALIAQVTSKRNQDAVRALGLLPLPADPAHRSRLGTAPGPPGVTGGIAPSRLPSAWRSGTRLQARWEESQKA